MADTVIMPKLGFDMAEGTLVRWVIAEGQAIHKGSVLAEIETDKATVEVESNFEGVVARHLVDEKDVVPVNTPIAIITALGESLPEGLDVGRQDSSEASAAEKATELPAQPATQPSAPTVVGSPSPAIKASPVARRLAREKGLDLSTLTGTGPMGRIIRKDVEAALSQPIAPDLTQPVIVPAPQTMLVPQQASQIPLTKLRAAIARRMAEAKQQVPHFYITHSYDMAAVMLLRKQVNSLLPEAEKLSVNDFIIKAVAVSLKSFPNLNASYQGNSVVQHGAVNIGIAVAIEGGLLTIVCRAADQKPLRLIASEVKTMVARAREGKVRPDDIEGSTFSISNLGMYDVEVFSAIINPPEAAILAVSSAKEVPIVKDGQLTVGTRMNATISVDHRVSDGVEAAKFMQSLAEVLENPLKILL